MASSATATVANGVAVHSVAVQAEKPAAAPAGARLSATVACRTPASAPLRHSPMLVALALPCVFGRSGSCLYSPALSCSLFASLADNGVCVVHQWKGQCAW